MLRVFAAVVFLSACRHEATAPTCEIGGLSLTCPPGYLVESYTMSGESGQVFCVGKRDGKYADILCNEPPCPTGQRHAELVNGTTVTCIPIEPAAPMPKSH